MVQQRIKSLKQVGSSKKRNTLNSCDMKVIKDFSNHLIENAMANSTSTEYQHEIVRFYLWLKEDPTHNKSMLFTRDNILNYKCYIKNDLNNSAETINRKLAALRSFNEYLIENKYMNNLMVLHNDYVSIQVKYANPSTINENEVEDFLNSVKENESKRNYAISCILIYCGLRISECLGLEQDFVDLTNKQLIVRNGKGNKQRIVYMNNKVVNAIQDYITNERESNSYKQHHDSKYLFISRQSEKLTTQATSTWIKKYGKKLHPHIFRHFFGSNALNKGYTIAEIMNQMGHSNIATTSRYTNPTIEEMKQKAEML